MPGTPPDSTPPPAPPGQALGPWPDEPALRAAIEAAAGRIAPHVRRTPCIELHADDAGFDGTLVLKLEQLQHTGSFKPRGAFNRLLSGPVPASGVIAASGGNHGAAVAFAARALGHRAEIFVPEIASPVKVERLAAYGADVRVIGADYAEALEACRARQRETGALDVHAYDQPETVAGQGTVGREMLEQAGSLDVLLVAVGGGGLIGGIAGWCGETVRVVGVEPSRAPTLARAFDTGGPTDVAVGGIAADSLGARRIGDIAWSIARRRVDRVVLVEDADIAAARRDLWQRLRLATEPAGAAALAALRAGAFRPEPGERRVGLVVCGANASPADLDG